MNPDQLHLDGSKVGRLYEVTVQEKRPDRVEKPDDYETVAHPQGQKTKLLRNAEDWRAALREIADTAPDLHEDWTELVVRVKPKGER